MITNKNSKYINPECSMKYCPPKPMPYKQSNSHKSFKISLEVKTIFLSLIVLLYLFVNIVKIKRLNLFCLK